MKSRKFKKGQTMVEYIIIVALIAISLIAVFTYFGRGVGKKVAGATAAISEEEGSKAKQAVEELDEMIKTTKAYKLMSGARGMAKSDIDAMKDTIRKLVKISIENPEIKELEINPVIAGKEGQGCWAVDCLCVLKN